MNASPRKLKNGQWGAQTNSTVRVGDVVTIVTKLGKRWDATVKNVVWKNKKLGRAIVEVDNVADAEGE